MPLFARASFGIPAAALLVLAAQLALAQPAYPVRPVRIIVPTSPPGGADVVGRLMAPALSECMGQQFFVENRAGASTMIGGEFVVKSPPDGYTLMMGISTLVINPATFRKMPYDALLRHNGQADRALRRIHESAQPGRPQSRRVPGPAMDARRHGTGIAA